jgi:hypothetical protein
MMKDVCKDMHEAAVIAHNPPKDLSPDEQRKKSEIQISGPLVDSFKRTALRLTKFESLKAEIYRKLYRDHCLLVLGIPLPPNDNIHDAVIPRRHPPMTPYNDPSSWHHQRTGSGSPIVSGPSAPIKGYATVNTRAGTLSLGNIITNPNPEGRLHLYSNAETLLVTQSPAQRTRSFVGGQWLVGGPGNTDPQMYEGVGVDMMGNMMVLGGNHGLRVVNSLDTDAGSGPVGDARAHHVQATSGLLARLRVTGSDVEMTDADIPTLTEGETTAGASGTDNEVV